MVLPEPRGRANQRDLAPQRSHSHWWKYCPKLRKRGSKNTSWLIGKDPDAGRDWGQEEKGMTEDEVVGWHHRLDGHESKWTPGVGDGQGGLACCNSWGHKESDTTELLNWTELMLLRNTKEWITALSYNMDEPQEHYVNEGNQMPKTYIILLHLYEMFRKGRSIETEIRLAIVWGWR